MRTIFLTGLVIAAVPATGHSQSDLKKIGNFIQQLQQPQRQQNSQPSGGYQLRNAPVQGGAPNSSGNQNQGNFNRNDFFGPQNGVGMNRIPGQQQGFRPNGRVIYPNGTYPNGSYPQNTYPNNQYPNQQYPGQTTYPNSRIVYPQGTSTIRTVYSDPPIAPKKTYNNLPIVIRCSPNATGTCHYELQTPKGSSFPYTIAGGQTQNLRATTDWTIRYRPSSSGAFVSYRLRGGRTYEIRKNGMSWQLYMVP